MPIRPENRKRYPPDWPETSRRIRHERARRRCECEGECGLHKGRRCEEYDGEPACWANGTIVLTVAHLNHRPEDCRDENLKAMCQRCHNRYDAPARRRGIRERRLAGQQNLELETETTDG